VDVLDHRLTLAADSFLAIDPDAVPLPGPPHIVARTPFDFRQTTAIGARIRHDDTPLRAAEATATISASAAPVK
jgi:aldose 1-epimerase